MSSLHSLSQGSFSEAMVPPSLRTTPSPTPSLQPLYTHTTMTKSKIPYERPEVEFFTLPSYLHSILISFSVEARP